MSKSKDKTNCEHEYCPTAWFTDKDNRCWMILHCSECDWEKIIEGSLCTEDDEGD